jgi:hypothetical protein
MILPFRNHGAQLIAALALALPMTTTTADEGMWLYTNPPKEQIRKKYGFELTPAWLEHLQKASVRFNSGGSGSFVGEDGLVISNHHVGADALQKLSTEKRNLLKEGFHAKTTSEELKCVDLELNILQDIEDVTTRINAAIPSGASPEESFKARRRAIAQIEKESTERTQLRSDVVTLYQGGQYHLYRFKRYTDVRLVFAPEQQAAFFGGDPDNFEFPRFNLDVCFFRVYENNQPIQVPHFLKWSANGPKDGELTFVSGHPGKTSRLLTTPELEYLRDVQFPYSLELLKRREVLLSSWGARSAENARRAKDQLFGIQNSRKARDGGHAGLYDPVLMKGKADAEKALRAKIQDPATQAAYDTIATVQRKIQEIALPYRMLESGHAFDSESFHIARSLLRAAEEFPKPNGERLRGFTDSSKAEFELELFSDKPIYEDLEIVTLSDSLTFFCEKMGPQNPLVVQVLAGRSPRDRAAELIRATRVRDIAVRKKLLAGGADAVRDAKDPMIELARIVDGEARRLRKEIEALDESKQQSHAKIAKARYEIEGASSYPDATFTLRLSYGEVKGFEDNGQRIPAMTDLAGLYKRHQDMGGREPFDLPERWLKRKKALNLKTPFNFVGTHDIIGGNSGSPVVNRNAEFVGIIFDGNIQSLVLDFVYDDTKARSLSVHSAAIIESLDKVYGAKSLVKELRTGKRP